MDRQIIYVGQIPQDLDLLNTNKNTMVALGFLMQALLGTSTYVDGLACTATSPATLTVNVAGGSIYALEQIDATGYGSIPADTTDQIVKQGIIIPTTNFSTPAPGTVGQSVVYLVQAAYQDTDGGSTVLPYYNASNPAVPYSGPGNNGQPQNTIRKGVCLLSLKTGVAATTGTQVTPTPDAGYVGLWAITVANGQSTVTSANIQQLTTAPFISPKLTTVLATMQAGSANAAHDTSGVANTITIALNPAVTSLTDGMTARVKVANANTGSVVMNTNGLGNVSVVTTTGATIASGAFAANGWYSFTYDANGTRWIYDGLGAIPIRTTHERLITATGTYTPSPGFLYGIFELVGGGGGGGGVGSSASTSAAGGGQGGAYCKALLTASQIGASQSLTLGSAGTAGANTGGNGGQGGTSSLGSLLTAPGGDGGSGTNGTSVAAVGGHNTTAPTGGTINRIGMPGNNAALFPSGQQAGAGGSSPFGVGGYGPVSNSAGIAGQGYGAGGSGATATASGNAAAGAPGTAGALYVIEYCSQ